MINSSLSSQKNEKKGKVAVGLSGGVDSAVAAFLLKEQGYEVTGVFMQCWEVKQNGCAADADKAYAIQNAAKLGIKFESLNFVSEYKKKVIDYFYEEYQAGRTPNPDVMCNKEIKFGLFYDWAVKNGYDFIATGHYARVEEDENKYSIKTGKDVSKDQSYFLYRITQEALSKTLFPVGDLLKKDIRKIAEEQNLPSAKREESMGICFIGEVDIKKFLEERIEHKKGNVVDIKGNIIGDHDGVWFLTIGQRHGFNLKKYFGNPMYVISKNSEKNEVVVGTREEALRSDFRVSDVSWINEDPFEKSANLKCLVRIRHLGEFYDCDVKKGVDGGLNVLLKNPAFGVAPGQSAVFYNSDVVLGGGIIEI